MIAVAIEEMHGSDRKPSLKTITSEPGLETAISTRAKMAHFSECSHRYASKMLDTADIVREAIYQQFDIQLGNHD